MDALLAIETQSDLYYITNSVGSRTVEPCDETQSPSSSTFSFLGKRGDAFIDNVRQKGKQIDNLPYDPTRTPSEETDIANRSHMQARIFVCLLSWPAAVTSGWLLGDKQNVIAVESLWNGPFPITNSPGFALLVLTSIPWLVGVILAIQKPRKKLGFWMCVLSAIMGLGFSFLLWFAFNAI